MPLVAFAICSNIPTHIPVYLILRVWMALRLSIRIKHVSNLIMIDSPILGDLCIISTKGCLVQLPWLRRVSASSFRSAGGAILRMLRRFSLFLTCTISYAASCLTVAALRKIPSMILRRLCSILYFAARWVLAGLVSPFSYHPPSPPPAASLYDAPESVCLLL